MQQYIKDSSKSVQEVVDTICEKASNYKFGVLHIHNVKETLNSKGVEFDDECQILDVCNPGVAKEFLTVNRNLSSIMPCKISVYSKDGQTSVVMNPVEDLARPIEESVLPLAKTTQETLYKLIDEAI
ncbi:DUF302 domain-containing protein [Halarcobacter sp.]|uniref:DUF302 domain-containing protein n=1 Tax=Halarcobacter sp. TaxID=2321133 RepID=UPI003A8F5377